MERLNSPKGKNGENNKNKKVSPRKKNQIVNPNSNQLQKKNQIVMKPKSPSSSPKASPTKEKIKTSQSPAQEEMNRPNISLRNFLPNNNNINSDLSKNSDNKDPNENNSTEVAVLKTQINALTAENKELRSRLLLLEKFLKPQFNSALILKQLILSDIIIDISEFDIFNKRLLRHNKRSVYNLLFKATVDGDKSDAFHNVCDQYNNTLVLIKTDKGRRFGGYAYEKWEGEDISKVDNRAFIFSIDKKKVFPVIRGEEAIGCFKLNGPDFSGWQIVIQDNFLSNKKCYTGEKGCNYETDEDYEINGGEKYFGVSELEVFQLKYE